MALLSYILFSPIMKNFCESCSDDHKPAGKRSLQHREMFLIILFWMRNCLLKLSKIKINLSLPPSLIYITVATMSLLYSIFTSSGWIIISVLWEKNYMKTLINGWIWLLSRRRRSVPGGRSRSGFTSDFLFSF